MTEKSEDELISLLVAVFRDVGSKLMQNARPDAKAKEAGMKAAMDGRL